MAAKEINVNSLMNEVKTGIRSEYENQGKKTMDFLVENYILIVGVFIAIVILLIIFFTSKSFRVGRRYDRMKIIERYQEITTFNYSQYGNLKLCDCRIASSYNTTHSGYQMYDYTSELMVLKKLQCGSRYLEFNIFNNKFGSEAIPVVANGYKKGEWKMVLNTTPLEYCFDVIARNAFKIRTGDEGVPNPEDPIFIGLNLNTNNNIDCLDIVADLIIDYFRDKLLPTKYSFQSTDDFHSIKMNELMEKVIIFSSDGFQGSGLEELVNYSWDNVNNNPNHNMQRIHYSELNDDNFDNARLIEYNKKGLTIIVPHKEGDFLTKNYNPVKSFELGCQFVSMNFHEIDYNFDTYITEFKNNSILIKPKKLRSSYKIIQKQEQDTEKDE